MRIVLDCANGAAYKVAPTILQELDADVIVINDKPNGYNINDECGALHPKELGKLVTKLRADIGIALDGDADRLIVVDENGEVIDGDKLIGSLAVYLKKTNKLQGGCVATVMSNIALEEYLKKNEIKFLRSAVGDKYVLEIMKRENFNFGGEQSGHIIFSNYAKTGDGLASALQVLALIITSGKKASEVLNPFELSPQILKNIIVENKTPLENILGLKELLESFKSKGLRDLIRYSGTENKIRLLLEGKDFHVVEECMSELQTFIKSKLC
jgi:phosphoglucosamine mutase